LAEYGRNYREKNKQRLDQAKRNYRKDNEQKIIERSRDYRKNNIEKIIKAERNYRKNNIEKTSERSRDYRFKNREKLDEAKRNWRQHNRLRTNEYARNSNYKSLGLTPDEFHQQKEASQISRRNRGSARWKTYYQSNKEKRAESKRAVQEDKKTRAALQTRRSNPLQTHSVKPDPAQKISGRPKRGSTQPPPTLTPSFYPNLQATPNQIPLTQNPKKYSKNQKKL
jgi:hypothetical protein